MTHPPAGGGHNQGLLRAHLWALLKEQDTTHYTPPALKSQCLQKVAILKVYL